MCASSQSSKTTMNNCRATKDQIRRFLNQAPIFSACQRQQHQQQQPQHHRGCGRLAEGMLHGVAQGLAPAVAVLGLLPITSVVPGHKPGPAISTQDLQYHPTTAIAARSDHHTDMHTPLCIIAPAPSPVSSPQLNPPSVESPARTCSQNVWGHGINISLIARPPNHCKCVYTHPLLTWCTLPPTNLQTASTISRLLYHLVHTIMQLPVTDFRCRFTPPAWFGVLYVVGAPLPALTLRHSLRCGSIRPTPPIHHTGIHSDLSMPSMSIPSP
ncbi:hypothetical protein FIBSPDRAFT_902458 [Athelia psychrophila]|uniref:Uncharacterized protein n=1 Tax=Athelia psychrophila TaxID=1759441 RepID=A0A167X777_9AGAM|nr:hypothetical protein FIBSPDRAFT_902458 [Fibularhizoctonia sp. CBS 109695]